MQVIKKIHRLIPYDQARVYFVNDSGKICDQVLIGVDQTWSDVYLEHYSRIENGRYSIPNRGYLIPNRIERGRYSFPDLEGSVYDWTSYNGDEFMTEYIRPQRLSYSAGFAFHDADGLIKSVYMLDRTGRNEYTRREIDIMSVVQPHLDNLHRNLFVSVIDGDAFRESGGPEGSHQEGSADRRTAVQGVDSDQDRPDIIPEPADRIQAYREYSREAQRIKPTGTAPGIAD